MLKAQLDAKRADLKMEKEEYAQLLDFGNRRQSIESSSISEGSSISSSVSVNERKSRSEFGIRGFRSSSVACKTNALKVPWNSFHSRYRELQLSKRRGSADMSSESSFR